VAGYWAAGTAEGLAAHKAFAEYVYRFFAGVLAQDAKSRAFLQENPTESFPAAKMRLEHRASTVAPIGYDEVVQLVIDGRADEAVERLRSLAAVEPNHVLLRASSLERLTFSLLGTWGLAEETIPLLELMVERYPTSDRAQIMLGEAHILVEDYAAAIEVYGRFLEQYPENVWGKSRLEWLRSR
jgi:predicted Zn-dependent protease